jgi:hypothetical protein
VLATLARGLGRGIDGLFQGAVPSGVYSFLRIGTATIFLVRHSDWFRPWVYLEHHRFVRGLMFLDPPLAEPRLLSPLISGFSLSHGATHALVYLRTALSLMLLFGVRARLSAGLLAVVSYLLVAADRYRYYHHLHLLYVALVWLALAPIGSSLDLERGIRRLFVRAGEGFSSLRQSLAAETPLWPLQLIRALVVGVYVAAGVSKLDPSWLRGDSLLALERTYLIKGELWEMTRDVLGYAGVARLSCVTELLLPIGLLLRPTRRAAVLAGWGFHFGISACMPVYSFGAQMAVLLVAFLPKNRGPTDALTEPAGRKH